MKKYTGILLAAATLLCARTTQVTAQQKATTPKGTKTAAATPAAKPTAMKKTKDGFTILPGGVQFKIINDVPGKNTEVGQYINMNIKMKADTQLLQSTWTDGRPASIPCKPSNAKADFTTVFPYLSKGDSAVVRIAMDTIIAANPGQQLPPFIKKGKSIFFEVTVADIKTADEFKKEMDDRNKEMQAAMGKVAENDDKLIRDYLATNNIKAEKTNSGLYYSVKKEGQGAEVAKGQKVSVNYTGKLLNGKMFDSNTDPSKGHVQPFEFNVGAGNVIPGWDEGLTYFKKGTQGTLYIPSTLGYGPRGSGPDIGPNSVLVFDIEVLDIK